MGVPDYGTNISCCNAACAAWWGLFDDFKRWIGYSKLQIFSQCRVCVYEDLNNLSKANQLMTTRLYFRSSASRHCPSIASAAWLSEAPMICVTILMRPFLHQRQYAEKSRGCCIPYRVSSAWFRLVVSWFVIRECHVAAWDVCRRDNMDSCVHGADNLEFSWVRPAGGHGEQPHETIRFLDDFVPWSVVTSSPSLDDYHPETWRRHTKTTIFSKRAVYLL